MIRTVLARFIGFLSRRRAANSSRIGEEAPLRLESDDLPAPANGDVSDEEWARIMLKVTWSALF
jgi:hypothetical protein